MPQFWILFNYVYSLDKSETINEIENYSEGKFDSLDRNDYSVPIKRVKIKGLFKAQGKFRLITGKSHENHFVSRVFFVIATDAKTCCADYKSYIEQKVLAYNKFCGATSGLFGNCCKKMVVALQEEQSAYISLCETPGNFFNLLGPE